MNRERGWSPGEAGELGGLWPEEEGGGLEPEILGEPWVVGRGRRPAQAGHSEVSCRELLQGTGGGGAPW